MRVTSITVSRGVTMSVGKFESIRADASAMIELKEGDGDPTTHKATLTGIVEGWINEAIREHQHVVGADSVFKIQVTGVKQPPTPAAAPVSRKRQ
jgi:hypothetical protein